jgi:serine/threonine protein kinase
VFCTKNNEKAMVGTDDYLAPEQIVDSDAVDIRADIYSLGATLYFLLTGMSPYENESLAYQKLLKHLAQRPKPLLELRPEVPAGLVAIVEKMMAKNPWQRYQTPKAVVDALTPWTETPIPVPPATEMPRLCPALQIAGAESTPTTPISSTGSLSGWQIAMPEPAPSSSLFPERLKGSHAQPPTGTPPVTRSSGDTVQEPASSPNAPKEVHIQQQP